MSKQEGVLHWQEHAQPGRAATHGSHSALPLGLPGVSCSPKSSDWCPFCDFPFSRVRQTENFIKT